MNKLITLGMVVFVFFAVFVTTKTTYASTYIINGITVSVVGTHTGGSNGVTESLSETTIKNIANNYYYYALKSANHTFAWSGKGSCGNTTAYTVKVLNCPVTNKCSKDGTKLNTRSKSCKTTTTVCPCGGCTNGACKTCPEIEPPIDITIDDPIKDINEDPATCTEDIWKCGDWSSCSMDTQSRSCLMLYNCPNAVTPSPDLTQSCVPGGVTVPSCIDQEADGSCPPPKISFTANPKLIPKYGSCKLIWNVSGAETCKINNESVNAVTGTKLTDPLVASKIYTMTCTNGLSNASKVQLCSVQDVAEH